MPTEILKVSLVLCECGNIVPVIVRLHWALAMALVLADIAKTRFPTHSSAMFASKFLYCYR